MQILAVLDFSSTTSTLLSEVRKWTERLSAKLWLLHVTEPDPEDFVGPDPNSKPARNEVAHKFQDEHKRLGSAAKELRETGLETTALLVEGPTVETILQEADKLKVDVIIMGSHAHGVIRELVTGSMTRGIIRRSTCPVLVIPLHESESSPKE